MITEYRGFLIKPIKESPNLLNIAVEGRGGKIPDRLKGTYTSVGFAKGRIDAYLGVPQKKVAKNVSETDATSGD